MFSDKFYARLGHYLDFVKFLGATPIVMNSRNVFVSPPRLRLINCWIIVPSLFIYTILLYLQSVRLYFSHKTKNLYFTLVYSLCGTICSIMATCVAQDPVNVTKILNSSQQFIGTVHRKLFVASHDLRIIMRYIIYIIQAISFQVCTPFASTGILALKPVLWIR